MILFMYKVEKQRHRISDEAEAVEDAEVALHNADDNPETK